MRGVVARFGPMEGSMADAGRGGGAERDGPLLVGGLGAWTTLCGRVGGGGGAAALGASDPA
jgi:hypothetical protein